MPLYSVPSSTPDNSFGLLVVCSYFHSTYFYATSVYYERVGNI